MINKTQQKRIAAIHDISGIGKCSLTVALPVLSAAGIETAVIPTAILSTHTGGFSGYTYRDLTDDMLPIAKHWKENNFHFDAIYSGFLGSAQQIDIVCKIIEMISSDDTLSLIDPAMADNGKLYATFSPEFPEYMKKLAGMADILTPNITECCLLTNSEYKAGPYTKEYIENLLKKTSELGCKNIVLTGVYFDSQSLGAAVYNCESAKLEYVLSKKEDGFYHGTGDVFASALLAAIQNGFSLADSAHVAVSYVRECIIATQNMKNPIKYGVNFEQALPLLMKRLGLI